MSPLPGAAELLRALGLDVDGPVRWSGKVTSSAAGIFVVEIAEPRAHAPTDIVAVRQWIARVPSLTVDAERPSETTLASRLDTFWATNHPLLYVGRSSKSLSARVGALYATELGHSRPHPGGHWLKTLRDPSNLRLWWAETDAPEEYEDALIAAFVASLPDAVREALAQHGPVLPWANLSSASLGSRRTGISASLLSAEATPDTSTSVSRSQKGTRTTRKKQGTTSTAAPRPQRSTAAKKAGLKDRPTPVTAEGKAALEAELERLTKIERPVVIERVKDARELGDLRENADYEAARNEQSFLEGSILALEEKLRTAVVIAAARSDAISLGSNVRYQLDGEEAELTIVGSTESDPTVGRISQASPVGKALMGHRLGDEIVVKTPAAEIRYRIVEVS